MTQLREPLKFSKPVNPRQDCESPFLNLQHAMGIEDFDQLEPVLNPKPEPVFSQVPTIGHLFHVNELMINQNAVHLTAENECDEMNIPTDGMSLLTE